MNTFNGMGRVPRGRLSQVCCLRLLSFFLLGVLLFGAGCAKQPQPIQTPPENANVAETDAKHDVIAAAKSAIGTPYRFGGRSPETGFDCSGLVSWSYEQAGIKLPRRAREQLSYGASVPKSELQPGDIVVFKGTRGRTGWHSGIYTGDNKFVHSPNKGKTVTETSLDEAYYAKRFAGACRIPRDGDAETLYAAYQAKQQALAAEAKASKKTPPKAAKKSKKQRLVADAKAKPSKAKAKSSGGKNKQAAAVSTLRAEAKPDAPADRNQAAKSVRNKNAARLKQSKS